MKPKKILYVDGNTDGTVGGAQHSLLYLAQGLENNKYDPTVIFYSNHSLVQKYINSGIKTVIFSKPRPFHIHKWLPSWLYNFAFLAPLWKSIQRSINFAKYFLFPSVKYAFYLRKNQFNLIHLNNTILRNHEWMFASRLAGIKCVSHERGINPEYSAMSKYFSKHINGIICISNAVRNNFSGKGLREDNMVTIYNGLDPKRIQAQKNPEVVKTQFGINPSAPIIGIVGNIREWKGQETVIEATALAKKVHSNIICLIVGETAEPDLYYKAKLDTIIGNLNLEDNVIFTGFQQNSADIVSIMDIVIHASTSPEPFGRVIIEAMALRKPIIGTRAGAVPEIIDEGRCGLMFIPGNAEELATHIISLLDDKTLRKSMGENGFIRVSEKFPITKNITSTQNLYKKLLGTM